MILMLHAWDNFHSSCWRDALEDVLVWRAVSKAMCEYNCKDIID